MARTAVSGSKRKTRTQTTPGPLVRAARANSWRWVSDSPKRTLPLSVIENDQSCRRKINQHFVTGMEHERARLAVHHLGPHRLRTSTQQVMRLRSDVDPLLDLHPKAVFDDVVRHGTKLHFLRANGQRDSFTA